MAKVIVTFEADSWHEALSAIAGVMTVAAPSAAPPLQGRNSDFVPNEPEPVPAPEPKRAARAKPSATKASPAPEPEPELEPEAPSAPTPPASSMPALEVLKQAVTVAVRSAQKNGGPRKILELLPDFKTETGLDFVMNSKEEHRPALYNLVRAAGLDV